MTPETDNSCTGDATQRGQLSATVAHGQIHVNICQIGRVSSHLMPAPKGCMRLALLPPDGAASISRSSLSDSFLPFVAELAACLAV